jgi:hypothetical protein
MKTTNFVRTIQKPALWADTSKNDTFSNNVIMWKESLKRPIEIYLEV